MDWDWIPKTLFVVIGFRWSDVCCGMGILLAFFRFFCVACLGLGFEVVGCFPCVVKLAFGLENVGWNVKLYSCVIIPRVLSLTRVRGKVC